MVYETLKVGTIITDKGHIRFTPGDLIPDSKTEKFSQFDSADENVQKVLGMTAKELECEIESSRQFKRSVPGVVGIWLKKTRMSENEKKREGELFADVLRSFTDEELRDKCAALEVTFNVAAERNELISALIEARDSKEISVADIVRATTEAKKPKAAKKGKVADATAEG